MKLAALFCLSISAFAQTAASIPKWAGCGGSFSDPGFAGWCALAVPVSSNLYSFTLQQFIPGPTKSPSIVTSTGAAMVSCGIKLWGGTLYCVGLGTLGVAVTSTATSFSPSGGGMALWRSAKGWTLQIGAIENKVGSVTRPQWIAGPGITW